MLELRDVVVKYQAVEALRGITMEVEDGTIVALLGNNGAGKTTTLNCISGIVPVYAGRISYQGVRVDNLATERIVRLGIAQVPEGKRIWQYMTVYENIKMGGALRKWDRSLNTDIDYIYELFPRLRERKNQQAGKLSGGEQQMLAIARGLMAQPKLLLLDEPSLGLAPLLVDRIGESVLDINKQGITVLLVEQNASLAFGLSQKGYVLETGRVVSSGAIERLRDDPYVKKAYLGM
jgi:branched-chain amino acid transport system ATP-binding protein